MRIVQTASSMISQPTVSGSAAPSLPASAFQARLGATGGGAGARRRLRVPRRLGHETAGTGVRKATAG